MTYSGRSSYLVSAAKITLPLIALVLLSTLFLFSGRIDPYSAIPYAEVDVEKLAQEAAVIRPEYAGVTEDGATLVATAERALPDPAGGQGARVQAVEAELTTAKGLAVKLSAQDGRFDPLGTGLTLSETVSLTLSSGYAMRSDKVLVNTEATEITSPGPVLVEAPFGTLEAGSMRLSGGEKDASGRLVFNDRVKLIYWPGK